MYNPWLGYGASKSANVLFSQSVADRLKASGGQSYSVHPGRKFFNFKVKTHSGRARLDNCIVILESKLQSNTNVTPELFQQGVDLAKEIFGGQYRDYYL